MSATNTSMTYLMRSTDGEIYTKLVDIKDFPDFFPSPDTLETTTLSDGAKTYILDIIDPGGNLEFTCNYDYSTFNTLKGYEGSLAYYAVWFGTADGTTSGDPDGSLGKFSWQGELSVGIVGAGTSAVREMKVTIAPMTEIAFA